MLNILTFHKFLKYLYINTNNKKFCLQLNLVDMKFQKHKKKVNLAYIRVSNYLKLFINIMSVYIYIIVCLN